MFVLIFTYILVKKLKNSSDFKIEPTKYNVAQATFHGQQYQKSPNTWLNNRTLVELRIYNCGNALIQCLNFF